MRNIKKRALFFVVIALTVLSDQITKNMVRVGVIYGERSELAGKTLILTRIENTGAFLGFASSFTPALRNALLLGLPFALLLILILYFFLSQKTDLPITLFLGMITGGGLSNLYDRFVYGSVTDFLFIDLNFFKTGIFNVADAAITVGIVLMFFYNVINRMRKPEEDSFSDIS